MFEAVTGYEPMGLKALQRMIKIRNKMKLFYPEEVRRQDNEENIEEYWEEYVRKCCPELSGEVDINNTDLLKKHKKFKRRIICLKYWEKKQNQIDPDQDPSIKSIPVVV